MCSQDEATAHEGQSESEIVEKVLKDLRTAVGNKGSKVVEVYEYEDTHEKNVKRIEAKTLPELQPVCEVLGVPLVGRDGRTRTKLELADKIVLQLEGLFPIDCQDCGEKYRIEIGKKPLMRCFLCGQGAHACTFSVKGSRKGSVWLCSCCWNKNEANTDREDAIAKDPLIEEEGDSEEEEEEEKEEDKGGRKEDEKKAAVDGDSTMEISSGNVCSYYLNKMCRHGRKGDKLFNGKPCPKLHPDLCKKFCNYGDSRRYGCSKGGSCRLYHPIICKGSDARRQCLNKQCKMTHLLHTRRVREDAHSSGTTEAKNRKSFAHAVDTADTAFRPKRRRNMTEPEKRGEPVTKEFLLETLGKVKTEPPRKEIQKEKRNEPNQPITKDFLLKILEDMKAEIKQSVVLQLMEFKTQVVDPVAGNKVPVWGSAGTHPIYHSFTS